MRNKLKYIFSAVLLCSVLIFPSAITAYAVPDDYLDDIWNGVNSAIDDFTNGDATEPDYPTQPSESYTEPSEAPTDPPTDPPTEAPTEPATTITAPVEDEDYYDDYDYSNILPTEEDEDYYDPEVLTETYTDAPFLDRLSISDAGEGNLFVALGIWASIIVGFIIVLSIVIATHKRKKGGA